MTNRTTGRTLRPDLPLMVRTLVPRSGSRWDAYRDARRHPRAGDLRKRRRPRGVSAPGFATDGRLLPNLASNHAASAAAAGSAPRSFVGAVANTSLLTALTGECRSAPGELSRALS